MGRYQNLSANGRGRRGLALLVAALILAGCSALPMPVDIDPGELRSGSQQVDLPLSVKTLDARIAPQLLTFSPPSTKLTYAEGLVRAKVSIVTAERATGSIKVRVYIAPASPRSGGACASSEVYKDQYLIGATTVEVGAQVDASFRGVLSKEAIAGVNEGKVCLGISFTGDFSDYVASATVSWKIDYIQVGVGIL